MKYDFCKNECDRLNLIACFADANCEDNCNMNCPYDNENSTEVE